MTANRMIALLVALYGFLLLILSLLMLPSAGSEQLPVIPEHEVGHIEERQPRRCGDNSDKTSPRVAVAFFGISRNLQATLPSFERHIFQVFERNKIQYDVFWHTMVASYVHNERTGDHEHGHVDPHDVRLLRPCRFSLTDQELVRAREFRLFLKARNIKDPSLNANRWPYDTWWDNYNSVKNMLCALYTQVGVADMIHVHAHAHSLRYDAVLSLRPDTALLNDIDLPQQLPLMKSDSNAIWVPSFQHWFGYNDRAAFGSPDAMHAFLRRGITYRDSDWKHTGEELVKHTVQLQNLSLHFSDMRVVRVRQDGKVSTRDMPFAMNLTAVRADADFERCVDAKTRLLRPEC